AQYRDCPQERDFTRGPQGTARRNAAAEENGGAVPRPDRPTQAPPPVARAAGTSPRPRWRARCAGAGRTGRRLAFAALQRQGPGRAAQATGLVGRLGGQDPGCVGAVRLQMGKRQDPPARPPTRSHRFAAQDGQARGHGETGRV
ncbi:MAG: hypothetical protein AVDCRST_MAG51-1857, partial [uncultured Ramlibacter sp.]